MTIDLHNPSQRFAALAVMSGSLIVVLFVLCNISYAYAYRGRFFPGTAVGSVALGGMTFEEGRALIHARTDALIEKGAEVHVNGSIGMIPLRVLSPDDPDLSHDLVVLNVDEAFARAEAVGRTGSEWVQSWEMIKTVFRGSHIDIPIEVHVAAIEAELLNTFAEHYDPATEPTFLFSKDESTDRWGVEVSPGSAGRAFDVEAAVTQFTNTMRNLNMLPVTIAVVDQRPRVSDAEANALVDEALVAVERTPYEMLYSVNRFEEYRYSADEAFLAAGLIVERGDDGVRLGLNETTAPFFATMEGDINVVAQNARFSVVDNRVEEFQPSAEGRAVDVDATRAALMATLGLESEEPAGIVVDVTQPTVTTESANTLGIKEILGVGTSGWGGSPANRIKNIKNGIDKLNGILIPPGTEFSAVDALEPVTIAGGYFLEMVIKGDEIKPEVGGGLCQIGTTLFRMAMNAGVDITERVNHGLVVSYYNDATNGNPGTDATLYGPHPDFRFINDTKHYMLITTAMDETNTGLRFTLWGTSDGRNGYYSPPVVHSWAPAGPPQTKYTTSLEPGVKKCQGAHPGADTSFTYYIERPDGTVEKEVFTSHYRPLPTICTIGALAEQIGEDGQLIEVAPVEPEVPVDAPDEQDTIEESPTE